MSGSHRTECPPYTRLLPLLLLLPLAAACSSDSTTSTPLTPPAPSLARMGVPGRTVSPTGADAGDCASAPCQTIGYAVAQADPGDRIDVAAGTYAETVQITKRLTLVGDGAIAVILPFLISGAFQGGFGIPLPGDSNIVQELLYWLRHRGA